jgi:hypothetical protein
MLHLSISHSRMSKIYKVYDNLYLEIKFIQPRQGTRLNPVDEDGKPINVKV